MSRSRSAPRAFSRTSNPVPSEPGNWRGWSRAYATRPLILAVNRRPSPSGTSTMSRGTETNDTVFATGSSDATIIVSVRYVRRPTPASTPMMRALIRGTAGVGVGEGLTDSLGGAVSRKLGSGSGGPEGTTAIGDGSLAKIASDVSRATCVAYPAYAWG